MIETIFATPSCIKCDNCKPALDSWVCTAPVNKEIELVTNPYSPCGFCHSFVFRSTRLEIEEE